MPRKLRKRNYDGPWVPLRARILQRDGHRCYVEGCTEPATTVDHIIPVLEADHLYLVESNLRASCRKHNYGRASKRGAELARVASRTPAPVRNWYER